MTTDALSRGSKPHSKVTGAARYEGGAEWTACCTRRWSGAPAERPGPAHRRGRARARHARRGRRSSRTKQRRVCRRQHSSHCCRNRPCISPANRSPWCSPRRHCGPPAASLCRVQLRVLPAVTADRSRHSTGAFTPRPPGAPPADSRRGDPERALAEAAVTVDRRYTTATNNHHPLEPQVVIASWRGDMLTVHTAVAGDLRSPRRRSPVLRPCARPDSRRLALSRRRLRRQGQRLVPRSDARRSWWRGSRPAGQARAGPRRRCSPWPGAAGRRSSSCVSARRGMAGLPPSA